MPTSDNDTLEQSIVVLTRRIQLYDRVVHSDEESVMRRTLARIERDKLVSARASIRHHLRIVRGEVVREPS